MGSASPRGWLSCLVMMGLIAGVVAVPGVAEVPEASAQSAPPAAPSSVTLTRGDGFIDVSWQPVDGATAYDIVYSTDDKVSWTRAATDVSDATTYRITGTDNLLSYVVAVRAGNSHGESDWTNSDRYDPAMSSAAAPASVTLERGNGFINVSWPAVPNATFDIVYSTDDKVSWTRADTGVSGATYTIPNTNNLLSYVVAVRAKNANGESGWTNSDRAGPVLTPSPARNVSLSRSSGMLTVTWDQCDAGQTWCNGGTAVTGYFINLSTDGRRSWTRIMESSTGLGTQMGTAPDPGFVRYSLTRNTGIYDNLPYVASVGIQNAVGVTWANSAQVAPSVSLGPVSSLTVHRGNTFLDVEWPHVTGATGYDVNYSADDKTSWTRALTNVSGGSGATRTARVTSIDNNKDYHVAIRPRALNSLGPWTDSARSEPAIDPLPPWNVSVSRSDGALSVSWDQCDTGVDWCNGGSEITEFAINLRAGAGKPWTRAKTITDPATELSIVENGDFDRWTVKLSEGIDNLTAYTVAVGVTNRMGTSWQNHGPLVPYDPVLSAAVSGTTATLTLGGGHTTDWWLKSLEPASIFCVKKSIPTQLLSNRVADTVYGLGAYSDSTCSTLLDAVYFTTDQHEVGNLAEVSAEGFGSLASGGVLATPFVTGGRPGGYELSSVTGRFTAPVGSPGDLSVAIHAADGANAANPAATALVTLEGTSPIAAGLHTYTCVAGMAGACDLAAGETYFVVMSAPNDGALNYHRVTVTASDDQKSRPRGAGWSIGNVTRWQGSGLDWIDLGGPLSSTALLHVAANDAMVRLEASGVTGSAATLGVANHVGGWWYKRTNPSGDSTCHAVASGTATGSVSSLDEGTTYTYGAYRDSACTTRIALLTFTTPSLAASGITANTATLTLSGHSGGWWYKRTNPSGDDTCHSAASGATATLLSLTAGTAYTYKAYSVTGCADANEIATETFTAGVSLTASSVTSTGATLTLAGRSGNWWLKQTAPTAGDCTAKNTVATETLTSLTPGTTYTYKGYSATGCADADEIAAETFTTPASLTASSITANTATLTLAGHSGNWWLQRDTPADTGCKAKGTTTTEDLAALTPGTTYTYAAYSNAACTTALATETFTTLASLSAVEITSTSAKLSLAGHVGDWWYKRTVPSGDNICYSVSSGSVASGLSPGTSHTFGAYSDSACTSSLATVTFTTLSFAVSGITGSGATLTLTGHSGNWWLKRTTPADTTCKSKDTTATETLSSLDEGVGYTYRAYRDSTCTTEIASVTFTTPSLAASSIGSNSATLTLTNWSSNWWLKRTTPADTTCKSKGTTATESLASLNPGTEYTYQAYSDSGCTAQIAAETFTTGKSLTATSITATSATLTLAGETGNWWLKRTTPADTTCKSKATTYTEDLIALTPGTTYTYKAYNASTCADATEIASETFATLELSVGSITSTSATLTLSGHSGNWWLRRLAPADAGCKAKTTGTEALATLAADTVYGYGAYRDNNCSVLLDSLYFSLTDFGAGNLAEPAHASLTATIGYSGNSSRNATAFETGSRSGGYTLAAVTGRFISATGSPGDISVAIHTASGVNPASNPKVTLEGSNPSSSGLHTFSCPAGAGDACDLAADTTYFVVMSTGDTSGDRYYSLVLTASDGERTHPAANGWEIADAGRYRLGTFAWQPNFSSTAGMFHIAANDAASRLSVTAVTDTTATLNITNRTTAWWYQRTTPTGDSTCHAGTAGTPTAGLTTLAPGTRHVYAAYSDSACSTRLDAASFTTLALTAAEVTTVSAKLSLSGRSGGWWYQRTAPVGDSTCHSVASADATGSLASLTPGSSYTYRAYSDSSCTSRLATVTFTASGTLTASSITTTGATLTLAGHSANWWLKRTTPADTTCKSKGTTATETLTNLTPGTTYTYKAYSDSSCATEIASETFSAAASLTASSITTTGATLTLAGHSANWWLKRTTPADATCKSKGTTATETLTNLTPGTTYTYKAYNASTCADTNEIASETFSAVASLSAGTITPTSAVLTLGAHSGNWWLKRTTPADTTCKSKGTTATETLTNLTPGTTYTYVAYSNSTCATQIATATFDTPASLTASSITSTAAVLTLAGHGGNWWLKRTAPTPAGDCKAKTTVATETLGSLTPGASYTYKAYSDSACTAEVAAATFSTPSLTASNVADTTATITIANHTGNWYYKASAAPDTSCTGPVTGSAKNLTGLTEAADYTYRAHANSTCTSEIASVSFTTHSLAAGSIAAFTATITVANHTGNWYYKADIAPDTSCKGPVTGNSKNLTGLSAGTRYTYVAFSDSTCTAKLASEVFTTLPTLTAGSITETTATLVLNPYSGNWWLKRTTPASTACKAKGSTYTESLTNLTVGATYTYKAYNASSCADAAEIATETFTTLNLVVTDITSTSGKLGFTGIGSLDKWSRKANTGPDTGCKNWFGPRTTTTALGLEDLTGLTKNTTYTYTAYQGYGCTSGKEIATSTFKTPPVPWDRNTSQEFNVQGLGLQVQGVWIDGSTMWVSTTNPAKLVAFSVVNRTRDPSKDFNTLDAAGNDHPRGMWSNSTTMWVADKYDGKIYAYKKSTKEHDSSKDFNTLKDEGNYDPRGIWSDGTTMWVSDATFTGIYAYNLSNKAFNQGKAIGSNIMNPNGTGNGTPTGIWSNGTTLWVADSTDDKLYAYSLSGGTRDSSKDFGTLNSEGNNSPTGVSGYLAGLWVADSSDDLVYAYNNSPGSSNYKNRLPDVEPILHGTPSGIWSNGTTIWVADPAADVAYAYHMSNKSRDSGKDFTGLSGAGNNSPRGLWSNGTTMWVVDSTDKKAYAYKMSDRTRDSGKDFNANCLATPAGIWSDHTTVWASNRHLASQTGNDQLCAYTLSSKSRDSGKDFTTLKNAGNRNPYGIWSNGTTMWVADPSDARIYAYSMSTKNRDTGKEKYLYNIGNKEPYGIWSNGTTTWITDYDDGKVYAYTGHGYFTISDIRATTATLTLSPHLGGTWYYKANKSPDNTCSSAQSGKTVSLTGLTANTAYTYTAYRDSSCSAHRQLASGSFTTRSS